MSIAISSDLCVRNKRMYFDELKNCKNYQPVNDER